LIGAFIIVLREVIEAGLILGIVLAATRGVPRRAAFVSYGLIGGVASAGAVALFAGAIVDVFAGSGQEILNGVVLILAVMMLAWHNAWMANHGRELASQMKAVGQAVASDSRPLAALAIVCGVAVLREGSEVVLFLYGIVASGSSGSALFAGGLLGIAGGAALTGLSYLGLVAIPARRIFRVTSILITFIAAGMAAQAVLYLDSAGVLTVLDQPAWDTSWALSQTSIVGLMLHTLLGYNDQPTAMQLMVYLATIAGMVVLMRFVAMPVPQRGVGRGVEGAEFTRNPT
jgi:high-affinity iron transporter